MGSRDVAGRNSQTTASNSMGVNFNLSADFGFAGFSLGIGIRNGNFNTTIGVSHIDPANPHTNINYTNNSQDIEDRPATGNPLLDSALDFDIDRSMSIGPAHVNMPNTDGSASNPGVGYTAPLGGLPFLGVGFEIEGEPGKRDFREITPLDRLLGAEDYPDIPFFEKVDLPTDFEFGEPWDPGVPTIIDPSDPSFWGLPEDPSPANPGQVYDPLTGGFRNSPAFNPTSPGNPQSGGSAAGHAARNGNDLIFLNQAIWEYRTGKENRNGKAIERRADRYEASAD